MGIVGGYLFCQSTGFVAVRAFAEDVHFKPWVSLDNRSVTAIVVETLHPAWATLARREQRFISIMSLTKRTRSHDG
jgi:hypothetical protein